MSEVQNSLADVRKKIFLNAEVEKNKNQMQEQIQIQIVWHASSLQSVFGYTAFDLVSKFISTSSNATQGQGILCQWEPKLLFTGGGCEDLVVK